jgi:hypothetical protein
LAEADSADRSEADINLGLEGIARLVAIRAGAEAEARLIGTIIERKVYGERAARVYRMQSSVTESEFCHAQSRIIRRARAMARRQEDAVARFVEVAGRRWQAMAARAFYPVHVPDQSLTALWSCARIPLDCVMRIRIDGNYMGSGGQNAFRLGQSRPSGSRKIKRRVKFRARQPDR